MNEAAAFARELVRAQLREWERLEPTVRRGDDVEAVHDMRVAARRLRAVLRGFRAALPDSVREAEADVRWLGRVLGQARDQDVQLAFLRKAATDEPDLDPLVGALHRERIQTQSGVVEALDSPRYARLRAALESSEEVPDAPGLADLAEAAVDHARRQVKRRAKKLDEDASGVAFHHLRKRAKRLRYLLEAATPVLGERALKEIKDLKRLQDMLGERQDLAASMETIQHLLHIPDLSRETVRAGERLLERLEREEKKCRKRGP